MTDVYVRLVAVCDPAGQGVDHVVFVQWWVCGSDAVQDHVGVGLGSVPIFLRSVESTRK